MIKTIIFAAAVFALALSAASPAYVEAAPPGKASPKSSSPEAKKDEGKKSSEMSQRLSIDDEEKDLPLFVKSNTLTLDSKARVFTYRGAVEASKGEMTITSDVMIGQYDEDNKIRTLTALGNVVITKGEALRASANRAVYDVEGARIELTESPEIIQHGNALSADKVTLYVNEDRSEAEGEVRVKVLKATEGDPLRGGGDKNKKGK